MTETADVKSKAAGRVLLPATIIPTRYDIKLTPDLEVFTFDGVETVRVTTSDDLGESCKEITMHAKELAFHSASYKVVDGDDVTVEAEEIRVHLKKTEVTFIFPTPMPASKTLDITINFTGQLNNQMAGFYRSKYTDIHGVSKIMASTQFEALDARRAFPCWDEPARKAIFGITLVVPQDLTAFSNMPEKSVRSIVKDNGIKKSALKEITYLDSPIMSSYLVAFCVGEFDYLQAMTEHGVLIKLYTPPGRSADGEFALDSAVKALDLYNDFFGVPYPLPKLDMVAIPEFAAGAMENWGLITYREVDLLIDNHKASSAQKQRVCIVVTHELAHQWFGNLVTMAWWDDLWLNEGFASWAENWATNELHPDWNMWGQFTTDHFASALRLDGMKSSHPIQVPIAHAEEVEEVFDAISYCKGASVVKMISAMLGKDNFRKGLANYMDKYKYSNTETVDLWKCWEDASGMPVGEMMASWTEQMGFPILNVTNETWEDDKVTLEVKQSWFLADGSEVLQGGDKKWCIPIMTCTSAGTQEDVVLMRERTATFTVPLTGPNDWVKVNAAQEVPMRVRYTPTMMDRLAEGIQSKVLPVPDRAGLLADAYALVKAGQMEPDVLIKLLSHYNAEDDSIVWESIESVLEGLHSVMSDDDVMSERFQKFAQGVVMGLTKVVGWDPSPEDGHLTSLMRGAMVRLLCTFCFDNDAVVKEATTRFAKFQENAADMVALPSDMRTSVFKIVLKNGGQTEYDGVLSYFDTADNQAERKFVLGSLGSTPDAELKLKTLEWAISGKVKLQDFFYPMGSVGRSSREGQEISWTFFQQHFDEIKGMIGSASSSLMDACIVSCCGRVCCTNKVDQIESFFKEHPLPRSSRKITQMLENMRTNSSFLKNLQDSPLKDAEFWDSL